MSWTDNARFLQYFRNLSNSFIKNFAILQDFNEIFSKYSFNITVLCGKWPCPISRTLSPINATYRRFTVYEWTLLIKSYFVWPFDDIDPNFPAKPVSYSQGRYLRCPSPILMILWYVVGHRKTRHMWSFLSAEKRI